jgi:hypothetical protein
LLGRENLREPEEFHALGARLDREFSVVKPFTRKRGFVFKARTWDELARWEAQRVVEEQHQRHQ